MSNKKIEIVEIIDNKKEEKGFFSIIKDKIKDKLEMDISIRKNKDTGKIGLSINTSFKDDDINN